MKILLTGATGFLGSHLCTAFNNQRDSLLATSQHGDETKNIHALPLEDESKIRACISQFMPDVIVHAGALVDLSRTYEVAQKCFETNTMGTLRLLEAARLEGIKEFIFVSSEEVYGNGPTPYSEEQKLYPPSPYAISKVAAEDLVRYYFDGIGRSSYILRIGTMYGPGQPDHRFIPQLVSDSLANKPLHIPSGNNKRDYIYIDDVVSGIKNAITFLGDSGSQTINVGSGESSTLFELISEIKKWTKSNSQIIDKAIPVRESEASAWLMNISKAKAVLEWEPQKNLSQGIHKMVNVKLYGHI